MKKRNQLKDSDVYKILKKFTVECVHGGDFDRDLKDTLSVLKRWWKVNENSHINQEQDLVDWYDECGSKVSPILKDGVKNYLIDIDGTVCEDIPNEEPDRMITTDPYPDALDTCNRWYDQGHIITFFTSRTEDLREVTDMWLKNNGFKYHGILMGKPRGGNYHWIDNHVVRSTRYVGNFSDMVEKDVKIQVFP